MQKFIAKYGLAAHLAIVSVAPLFLFPFCAEQTIAVVWLWLSLFGAIWCLLEPSVRSGETLHSARARIVYEIFHDPFSWALLVLVIVFGVRALNGGVRLAYNAEVQAWNLLSATLTVFPGCVSGKGTLPFALAVALLPLLMATRHSLGRSARAAFLLIASSLAGVAAFVILFLAQQGDPGCSRLLTSGPFDSSFFGFAFGFYFLGGLAALPTAFERQWNRAMIVFPLAIGGPAAGVFSFAPPVFPVAFAAAGLIVLGYSFVYAKKFFRQASEFKLLVVASISITVGVFLTMLLLPEKLLSARLSTILHYTFFTEAFLNVRAALSAVAFKVWQSAPWSGTGLGSFDLAVRYFAVPSDWAVIPRGMTGLPNGGWLLLAERGIVGASVLVILVGFLVFTYVLRIVRWAKSPRFPYASCVLTPLILALFIASMLVDCSLLRPDALAAALPMLAISAKSFPQERRGLNG